MRLSARLAIPAPAPRTRTRSTAKGHIFLYFKDLRPFSRLAHLRKTTQLNTISYYALRHNYDRITTLASFRKTSSGHQAQIAIRVPCRPCEKVREAVYPRVLKNKTPSSVREFTLVG
jgi:hypothetical protein